MPEISTDNSSGTNLQSSPHSLLLAGGAAELASAGVENSRLDAEMMLAAACQGSRAAVICGLAKIDRDARERYMAMIARRKRREPLAYILGYREFYSLEFEVTPAVLIPRPETETVVAGALNFIRNRPEARVCDIGTGSGAIAVSIAANAGGAHLTATDVSSDALMVARRNAIRLKLASRITFSEADCFDPIDKLEALGRFDLVVSNPPYIREDEIAWLSPEVSRFEPRIALAGGHDGLALYRRIAARLMGHVEHGGCVIVEIDADRSNVVTEIMRNAGATGTKVMCDLARLPRAVVAEFD
ncbi:MAG: peptide chain release factor N(5)-glutamine methyltransferase [Deltaproteobacteria bacterium]|nr:peptide chain release factor N(5)-glutamine methyltransferase [Deltaproteobacteria bacterium]